VREVERAYAVLAARGSDLVAVAHRLGDEAVEQLRVALAREMGERFFLRDILALREAFSTMPPASLPDEVAGLRTLPAALLDWLHSTLEIVPHLDSGQRLEVPRMSLGNFTVDGEQPPTHLSLLRLRVIAPGWKRRGQTLVRPVVVWDGAGGG
jgi:hypothetical protein